MKLLLQANANLHMIFNVHHIHSLAVEYVAKDPVFSPDDTYFLSSDDIKYERSMEQSIHYLKTIEELGLDKDEARLLIE